jgi:hypothetical protein
VKNLTATVGFLCRRVARLHIVTAALLVSATPATAADKPESRNERCQRQRIIMNCVMNHSSEALREACLRAGDPGTSPRERYQWCWDHGEDWEPYEPNEPPAGEIRLARRRV